MTLLSLLNCPYSDKLQENLNKLGYSFIFNMLSIRINELHGFGAHRLEIYVNDVNQDTLDVYLGS